MNKKIIKIIITSVLLVFAFTYTSLAGEWHSEKGYWEYNENGKDVCNQWKTIDGRDYLFNSEGRLLGDEGYPVNAPAGLDEAYWKETKQYALKNNASWQPALDLVNQTRIANGLNPLFLDIDMCMAATYRCVESTHWMVWDHWIGNGYRCDAIIGPISEGRIRKPIGENIGYHLSSGRFSTYDVNYRVQQIDNEFKNSTLHYANIVNPSYRGFGVGLALIPITGEYNLASNYIQLFLD